MSTLVTIKNLSRRRIRFGKQGALLPASPTGTGATLQVDIDDPYVRRDLFRNIGSWAHMPDVLVLKMSLSAANAGVNGGVGVLQNPEAQALFCHRTVLDVTTPAPATCTLDVGSTSTANGAADVTTIFSGQAISAAGTFVSNNVVKLASADWFSATAKVVNATGLVGNLYFHVSLT